MEIAQEWLEVAGLALILTFATYIFVRAVALAIRGKHQTVRFGVELLLVFTVLYLTASYALNLFGAQSYSDDLDKVIAFLWWISLAFTINAALNRFLWTGLLSDNGVRRVPKLLTDGAALLLYACAVMIVMHYVYDESIMAILATSGAAAFVLGLSAQSTLSEVFSGLSLNLAKSIKLGDFVEIDGVYGEIYDINWRSVSVKNPHTGSLYIFPNSAVTSKVILNFSQPTGLFKYWIVFHVEYSASPDLVISTIAEELEHTKYIRKDPKPDFNILGFTDLGMEYRVRFNFEGDDPWWDAQNEMCMAIWSALRKKGIRLSIDRHKLLSGDEQETNPWLFNNLVAEDEKQDISLERNTILKALPSGQIEELEKSARFLDLTPPDCIYKEGDVFEDIYFVDDGDLSIIQLQDDGSEATIGKYTSGDCIGFECIVNKEKVHCTFAIRADRFSRIYKLDSARLKDVVSESDSSSKALAEHLLLEQNDKERNLLLHQDNIRKARNAEHHALINLHLREHVEDVFSKPLLHHLIHVVFPRSVESDVLQALMAACALIASARGEADDVEREYLREKFESIGLFKHVPVDDGLALFEADVRMINEDTERGTHSALAKLRAVSSEPKLARIVMGVAHGMTSLHGDLTVSEQEQISKIADALRMPEEVESLVDMVKD